MVKEKSEDESRPRAASPGKTLRDRWGSLSESLKRSNKLRGSGKQKEHIGSDSGYEENGNSNTSKSHILNIKLLSATGLTGEECYIKIYVDGKRVATSKPLKDTFEWNEAYSSKIDYPTEGNISVQAFEKKTKDESIGQADKPMNTLNIGSNEIINFDLKKNDASVGQVKVGLHVIPPSGYVASDESIGDDTQNVGATNGDAAVPAEPVKPTTVGGLLQDPSCPNNFQVDIELQRGVGLKAMDSNGYSDPYCRFLMDGVLLCKSDTKKKNLNPEWNQFFAVKVPARPSKLVIEVFDHDVFGSNDMIGCNQIDISPLSLEVPSQQCITLRTAQTAPENPKLGQINFTLKVSPFDESNESMAVEGRHKGGKKILATVILRVLSVDNLRPPQLPAKTRSVSVKLRMDKQKFSTKIKRKTMIPSFNEQFIFTLFHEGAVLYKDQSLFLDMMDTVGKAVSSTTNTMGSAKLDLAQLERDVLHEIGVDIKNEKNKVQGVVRLAMTISGTESSKGKEEKYEHAKDTNQYGMLRTFKAFKDVGILKVTLHNAKGLIACDSFGKSDPYCYVDLGNQRFRSRTIYKTVNPEWERVFYFDITELYQNLFITIFDEDENDADDFMGRLCIPILEMRQNEKVEYKMKAKNLDKFHQGSLTITCSRFYNGFRGNIKLFKPMDEGYWKYEPKYNIATLFKNIDRLKAFEMPDMAPALKMMHDIIHWKTPILSFLVWLGAVGGVYTFEPWMITAALPPVLLLGRLAPGLFIKHKGDKTKKTKAAPVEGEEKEKKGLLEQKKALDKIILDVQKYIDFGAGLLEKGFHTFIWIRPQATFTLSILLCIVTGVLIYVPIRYILMLFLTKKLCIYGIKPNYRGNNEILDFMSRIPTIPDLTRFKAEIVERLPESDDEENSGDSSASDVDE